MYQPPHFREDRIEVQHALIRSRPLGLLITAGAGGLMANPIPFLLDSERPGPGVLRCHLARANPQWRELMGVEECMAVFQGPQSYITPSWYAVKRETGKVVPTWNYATVHAYGKASVISDRDWLGDLLRRLSERHEAREPVQWRMQDQPDAFLNGMLNGIVGFEVAISRLEGKFKLSQNRPAADRPRIIAALDARDDAESQSLARLMRALLQRGVELFQQVLLLGAQADRRLDHHAAK